MSSEEKLEYTRHYYLKNKEKILFNNKIWMVKNKERRKLYRKEHYHKNIEAYREYRIKNREQLILWHKKHYLKNKEEYDRINREWYSKNREKHLKKSNARTRMRRSNFPNELYERLIVEQSGLCYICNQKNYKSGKEASLCSDHYEDECRTKIPRKLLCHNCNAMLGHAKESPDILRRAAEYLEKFGRKPQPTPIVTPIATPIISEPV